MPIGLFLVWKSEAVTFSSSNPHCNFNTLWLRIYGTTKAYKKFELEIFNSVN